MRTEMIPIVDNNNNLIKYIDRDEFDKDNDIAQSSSVFVVKKDHSGKIFTLLAQRSFAKRFAPGQFAEAVGGTVNEYNDFKGTAIRECAEEIGIENVVLDIGPMQRLNEPSKTFVQWYIAEIDKPIEGFTIQKEELEQIIWISLEDLEKDLVENPNKYISSMPEIVRLLKPYAISFYVN